MTDEESNPAPRRPPPKKKPSRAKSGKRPAAARSQDETSINTSLNGETTTTSSMHDDFEAEINERKRAIEEKIFLLSKTRIRARVNNADSTFSFAAPTHEQSPQSQFFPGRIRDIREFQD
jgi:hypothetical protein